MRRPDILERFLRPPAAGASREQRLRFVRRCALFALAPVLLLWIDALVFGPTWLLVLVGVATGLSLLNLLSLNMRIGRAERPPPERGPSAR
jgi:hypothetical protein